MAFEDLLSLAMIEESTAAVEVLPPRPAGCLPEYGITHKGKLLKLKLMTPAEWDFFGFKRVTGTGWSHWFPVTPADKLAFATRKKGRAKAKTRVDQPPSDDYLARRGAK